MRKNILKTLAIILTLSLCVGLIACGDKKEAQEPTTKTDILAIEIVDKDGNKHTVEGVGVTDENGKTTITVTDKDGNKTVIEGTASTDDKGNTTVTGGTVVQGGTITKEDGTTIDTNGSKVEDIVDNNDGKIDTDVKVDETTKAEVESKKEEATQTPTKTDVANKEPVAPTTSVESETTAPTTSVEKETVAPTETPTTRPAETQTPTQTPTVAPTTKPTEAPTVKPTEAPTVKPTEAPTTKPMTEQEKQIQACIDGSTITEEVVYSTGEKYVEFRYKGSEEKIIVPKTYNGMRVHFILNGNNGATNVKEIIILGSNTSFMICESPNLETITVYTDKLGEAGSIAFCSLPKLKTLNLLGENLVIKSWFDCIIGFPKYEACSNVTVNINLSNLDNSDYKFPSKYFGKINFLK